MPNDAASWKERWNRAIDDGWMRENKRLPSRLVRVTPRKRGLPGSRLKSLLAGPPFWITPDSGGCKCQDRANQMDAWGVEGCRQRRDEIIGWLAERAAADGWPFARAGATLLVDAAIRLAAADEAAGD